VCRAVSPVSLAAGHLEVRLFLPVLTRTRGSVHKAWQNARVRSICTVPHD
jgi:hypothetical protein